ncbi:uncharacterized protein SAMN05444157_2596 [Frankineae bacterium MT45]|nr:uncharacterized protein SAMN05444157_2596 [Frankineae bacterium MT45]
MPEKTTQKHLDPRAPLVLDTRDLGRRPGAMLPLQRRVPAPAGLALDLVGVAEGAILTLDLQMQSVTEGVLITGTVSAPIQGECGRCLEAIDDELAVEICEMFAYPESTTDDTSEEDEVYRVVDDLLDLEPVVRDVVVLGLPMTPLCRPDCAGLCPTCGVALDDLPADHTHETVDPRWAALAAFATEESSSQDASAPAQPESDHQQ